MKNMNNHHSPLMSIISIITGSITAIISEPTIQVAKVFLLGAVGGCGGYLAKLILDKIREKLKK